MDRFACRALNLLVSEASPVSVMPAPFVSSCCCCCSSIAYDPSVDPRVQGVDKGSSFSIEEEDAMASGRTILDCDEAVETDWFPATPFIPSSIYCVSTVSTDFLPQKWVSSRGSGRFAGSRRLIAVGGQRRPSSGHRSKAPTGSHFNAIHLIPRDLLTLS